MNLRRLTSMSLVLMSVIMLQGCGSCGQQTIVENEDPVKEGDPVINEEYIPDEIEDVLSEPTDSLQDDIYAHFREYLHAGLKEDEYGGYFIASDTETAIPYYKTEFSVLDINGDGYNDLVVWGYLGLRCKTLCTLYEYYEGEYYEYNMMGIPYKYANGYLFIDDPDYAGAGEILYMDEYVYAPNAQYEPELILAHTCESICYDPETGAEYDPPIDTHNYNDGINELTAEEYEAKYNEYDQGSFAITYFELNNDNIENFCR